ncbi:MAG: hypothetical protein AAGL89_07865 [Pseudomonadota bacterium]
MKIFDDPPGRSVETVLRYDLKMLITALLLPFLILGLPEIEYWLKVLAFVLCWGGFAFYCVRSKGGQGRLPVFEADRTGFRLNGEPRRPWQDFLGARVERHWVNRQEAHSLLIQLEGQTFDRATQVGTYSYQTSADSAVQKILGFQRKVEVAKAKDAENFAVGVAPVVEARGGEFEPDATVMRRLGRRLGRLIR